MLINSCRFPHSICDGIYYICFIFPFLFKASRLWCSNWYDIWKWVCLMYIYSPFFNQPCFKRTLDLDVGAYAIKKLYSTTKWITWNVIVRCNRPLYSHFVIWRWSNMSSEIGTLYLNEITCIYVTLTYESSKTSKLEFSCVQKQKHCRILIFMLLGNTCARKQKSKDPYFDLN